MGKRLTMTFVYVLVSTEKDNYLEQALLSILSLKKHVLNAHITLLTDIQTRDSCIGTRSRILNEVTNIIAIPIGTEYPQRAKSRWLKTNMGQYLQDDFLYIDSDTVIASNLMTENMPEADICAAFDRNVYIHESPFMKESIKEVYPFSNLKELLSYDKYFNSGVIFCRNNDKTKQFFSLWHELWKESFRKGTVLDQPAFNAANLQMNNILHELPGEWNCQITMDLRYLENAKIIHYLVTNKYNIYLLADPDILKNIKQTGTISSEIETLLEHPKTAIRNTRRRIYTDNAVEFSETKLYAFFFTIYTKSRKIFNILEYFFIGIRKIRNIITGYKG